MKKVVLFSGSNSSSSINQQLVQFAANRLQNAEVQVLDLRDFPLPMYSIDIEKAEGIPENLEKLAALITEADSVVISTPEHNSLPPAFFKNVLDWISRMGYKLFAEKPVLIMSASPGPRGATKAADYLHTALGYQKAVVTGRFSLGRFFDLLKDGQMQDAEKLAELDERLSELVDFQVAV